MTENVAFESYFIFGTQNRKKNIYWKLSLMKEEKNNYSSCINSLKMEIPCSGDKIYFSAIF